MTQRCSSIQLTVACLLLGLSACGGTPLGPFAGGHLSAPEAQAPFDNWPAIAATDTVYLETDPEDPYSVQMWCIALDDALYVPTSLILGDSDPRERTWVRNVQENPSVRVQIGEAVYPMRASRVTSPERQQALLSAFQEKYAAELPEIDAHAENAWIFQLTAR